MASQRTKKSPFIATHLKPVSRWEEKNLEKEIRAFCDKKGLKPGQVFHPVRVAVSGRTEGPTLFGMLELLGKDAVLARLAAARRLLSPGAVSN